jgi:quinol monooxygenase YgiN
MRPEASFLLACAAIIAGALQPTQAQTLPQGGTPQSAPPQIYAATYFDVAPASAGEVVGLLHAFATATRKEDGNGGMTTLQESGRPGRFAIVEAWRDQATYDAHGTAVKALGDKLRLLFVAPFDSRVFAPLSIRRREAGASLDTAIWVLTHVDVFPAGKEEVAAMITTLSEQAEADPGFKRFDGVVSGDHPNHFHLIEAWADPKAQQAHAAADHTKAFRAKLVPFEGALYDERLYEVVK